jgi:hypothetical protein
MRMRADFGWLMYNNDCFKNNPRSKSQELKVVLKREGRMELKVCDNANDFTNYKIRTKCNTL